MSRVFDRSIESLPLVSIQSIYAKAEQSRAARDFSAAMEWFERLLPLFLSPTPARAQCYQRKHARFWQRSQVDALLEMEKDQIDDEMRTACYAFLAADAVMSIWHANPSLYNPRNGFRTDVLMDKLSQTNPTYHYQSAAVLVDHNDLQGSEQRLESYYVSWLSEVSAGVESYQTVCRRCFDFWENRAAKDEQQEVFFNAQKRHWSFQQLHDTLYYFFSDMEVSGVSWSSYETALQEFGRVELNADLCSELTELFAEIDVICFGELGLYRKIPELINRLKERFDHHQRVGSLSDSRDFDGVAFPGVGITAANASLLLNKILNGVSRLRGLADQNSYDLFILNPTHNIVVKRLPQKVSSNVPSGPR